MEHNPFFFFRRSPAHGSLVFLALMTLFAFTLTATGAQAQSAMSGASADFTDAEVQRIRAEALAAILAYPEIIEEAAAILQERRSNAALASVLQDPTRRCWATQKARSH